MAQKDNSARVAMTGSAMILSSYMFIWLGGAQWFSRVMTSHAAPTTLASVSDRFSYSHEKKQRNEKKL